MNKYDISLLVILLLTLLTNLYILPSVSSASSDSQFGDIKIKLSIAEVEEDEKPLRLSIPSASINLNVTVGEIDGNTWAVSENEATFAEGSSPLNQANGNTIIYAHARKDLFGNLGEIKIGDTISIIGNKSVYDYEIVEFDLILPEEVEEIKSSGEYNLTLFTCEGYRDENRLVVKAKRIDNIEIIKEVI